MEAQDFSGVTSKDLLQYIDTVQQLYKIIILKWHLFT